MITSGEVYAHVAYVMPVELVAGLIVLAATVLVGFIAYLGRSYIGVMQSTADNAHTEAVSAKDKAHALEVALLENKAKSSDQMRAVEVAFLDYKLYVSNEYVRRGDHSAILGEIFRKLETLSASVENKMESIGRKLDGKQDRLGRHVDNEARN